MKVLVGFSGFGINFCVQNTGFNEPITFEDCQFMVVDSTIGGFKSKYEGLVFLIHVVDKALEIVKGAVIDDKYVISRTPPSKDVISFFQDLFFQIIV